MQIQEVIVLVVDDVNAMRVQIQKLLEAFGFARILTAESGEAAKKILENEPVNFVLADWHMEPVNGMELLKWVRAHLKLKNLPFVLITAENTKEAVVQAVQAGVDQYVVKPLTKEIIQEKIFQVLVKKKVLI
jgi:two-component system chemotaxis response regulator CheY